MVFRTIHVNFHVLPLKLSNHFLFRELFSAHEKVLWVILYSTCQTDLPWTSGIYIRLSNNFAKRAGKWGAQSQLIITLTA